MTWRPLSVSGGKETRVKFDSDGRVIVNTQQECSGILDNNTSLRNDEDRGWCMGGDMRRVASIPLTVVHQWLQEGVDVFSGEHQAEVAKRLNDPDYSYLRTAPGQLGAVGDGTYR